MDAKLIPIPEAAVKYGIDVKRLRGYVWQNRLRDPIGSLETDQVVDDWRLQRLAVKDGDSHAIATEK
jgi:hypothetical protein